MLNITRTGTAVFLCVLSILIVGSTGIAAAQTSITSCTTITSSGNYVIDSDLDAGGGDCIQISANGVTLGNNGFIINNSDHAVNLSSGVSNIDINGVIVENASVAVNGETSTGSSLSGIVIDSLTAEIGITGDAVEFDLDDGSSISSLEITSSTINTSSEAIFIEGDYVDVSIADIVINGNQLEAGSDGVEIDSDDNRTDVRNIDITNNDIVAGSDGIYLDGDADPVGTARNILVSGNTIEFDTDGVEVDFGDDDDFGPARDITIRDNTLNGGSDGVVFDSDGDRVTVEAVDILDNDVTVTSDGIEPDIDGINSSYQFNIENNQIQGSPSDGFDIDADGDDSNVELYIDKNTVQDSGDAVDIDVDGNGQTLDIEFRNNNLVDFSGEGIEIDDLQMHDSVDIHFLFHNNLIDDGGSGNEGIDLDTDTGIGGPDGELIIEYNEIRATDEAIIKNSGPVTGIEIHKNILDAPNYGIENNNLTNNTYLDATNNYWGASNGPDSPVGTLLGDPVTGSLADGSGSNVSEGNTTNVSNVHFDSFANSPNVATPSDGPRVMPGGVGGRGGLAGGTANYVIRPVTSLPSTLNPGDVFNVTVQVTNEGSSGTQDVELLVNGEVVGSQIKGLLEEESEDVSFSHRLQSPGSYEISVNGEVIGTINVQEEQTQQDQEGEQDDESQEEDDSMEQQPDEEGEQQQDDSMEQDDDEQQGDEQQEQEEESGGEGLPGFTPVIAIIALITLSVVYRRR